MINKYQEILTGFFEKYKIKKYKKGEKILEAGEKNNQIGFMKSGYARAYLTGNNGQEMTLPILRPVFYITVINALFDKEAQYSLEAMTSAEVWWAPKKDVMDFFADKQPEQMEIARQMIWGFRDLTISMQKLLASDAYERVAFTLEFLFRNFGQMEGKQKQLNMAIPHRLISTMTGLSRETVTLQILKMVKKGIVSTKNRRMALVNEAKLEAATGL
jgi:CRP-like cAMP-binding protein